MLCGLPQNAKEIRNDVEKAKMLIAQNDQVIVSLAPSFVANYEGVTIGSMAKALKQLGFTAVEETAIGATIVKNQYEQLIRKENRM